MIFSANFEALTCHSPFPWQEELFKHFCDDPPYNIPSSCRIPTGLGKTNVIAIWLIALANGAKVPRRLVYVVNRRTVVDQTTDEVEKFRDHLADPDKYTQNPDQRFILKSLASKLKEKCALEWDTPLAISTLRGQFADNREWSADPTRPAVICGTVDMIGSRLLFSGYGCGFKTKPLHAGFLGQDVLLVHDEAHLEPAFQKLIETIQKEQKREIEHTGELPWPPLRIMAMSATSRENEDEKSVPFELTEKEKNPPAEIPDPPVNPVDHVWKRLKAKKLLYLVGCEEEKKIADRIADLALKDEIKKSKSAVLIFVHTLDDVEKVKTKLTGKNGVAESQVQLLTGTLRGFEQDNLVKNDLIFARFLPKRNGKSEQDDQSPDTVYLICTSAGEVGIDISADHMICDLTPLDSMIQRFGRVNRYGNGEATIQVVYPTEFSAKDDLTPFRENTREFLQSLKGNASPLALMEELEKIDTQDCFTPKPTILPATDILFDAWALTSIRGKMPGRPPVEPYLHGIREWEPPETYVAWREEVQRINTHELVERYNPKDLLEEYPLKPHELLRDRSDRILKQLQVLAKEHPDDAVWILDAQDQVSVKTLDELISNDKNAIHWSTIIFSPKLGGLTQNGTLDGNAKHDTKIEYDVADEWFANKERTMKRRIRIRSGSREVEPPQDNMRLIRIIDTDLDADERESEETEVNGKRFWHWYIRPRSADDDMTKTSTEPIKWDHHTKDVVDYATRIANALLKDKPELRNAICLAAQYHDLGKKRAIWQRSIGNPNPTDWYAKSGKDPKTKRRWLPLDICPNYRHEFGSLLDIQEETAFNDLHDDMKDVVLHLIATHHGFARPHFPPDNAYDPEHPDSISNQLSVEVVQRFARLQRKYGRWGLAYLESLLRAADYAASAKPSDGETNESEVPS